MDGYEKRTQQKREAIVKAARGLFATEGITAVSISDIAAEAEVSRVTIFKYFGSKEDLVTEAAQTWFACLAEEYQKITQSGLSFYPKLLQLLNMRLTGWEKIGEQHFNAAVWRDPEMKKVSYDFTRQYVLPIILDLIKEGQEAGRIDSSLDNEAVLAFFTAFNPIVQTPEYSKKSPAYQVSIFNLFMGGLIKDWYAYKDTP